MSGRRSQDRELNPDLADELRSEYARRARLDSGKDAYAPLNPAQVYFKGSRTEAAVRLFRSAGIETISGIRILEIGSGAGGILLEYMGLGASPEHLQGVDVLESRVEECRDLLPNASVDCVDAQVLPYDDHTFDMAIQYTAFSSVLSQASRTRMAEEMLRVLVKPAGVIMWYDFWLNPTNRNTVGIRLPEIRRLFPNCEVDAKRITLAPPIARRLAKRSFLACHVLDSLRIFNTHYLALIRQKP